MIQRVQSLYLLCSVIFMAIFACSPFFNIVSPDATYQLNSFGVKATQISETATTIATTQPSYVVAVISALIILLSIITIFLFKNRMKQILLCRINYLFYITLIVVMALLAFINYKALNGTTFSTTSFVVFPFCALITNWLAASAINKDEQLVRDSERMWTRNR